MENKSQVTIMKIIISPFSKKLAKKVKLISEICRDTAVKLLGNLNIKIPS